MDEFRCNGVGEPLDGNAGERGLMPKKPFKDGGKDTKGGIDVFTVDEDRHNTGKGLLQFVKYSPDAGGLTGPRRAAKVGVDGACSLQGRA